jgi:hypothetical protein
VPTSMGHRVAHLTVTVALVLLVGGCGDQRAESTTASEPSTTTLASTTLAPTTTGPRPLTARERAWLDAIPKARAKIDNALTEPNVTLTSSKMRSLANTLRSCRRQLLRAGSPSDRLRPIYALATQACREYDKGAQCFATAARMGTTLFGAADERRFRQAIDCGLAAQGKGLFPLGQAEQQASQLKATAG